MSEKACDPAVVLAGLKAARQMLAQIFSKTINFNIC
ncbi:hypothetical protein P3T25_002474 [Paraburkholderia sp. GAS32]